MDFKSLKRVVTLGTLAALILSFTLPLDPSLAQGVIEETVARRNLVIDLGEGLTTDAQLTFPAVGDGPFPGVLLIHGSGAADMDEYLPPFVTGTGEPARPFLQIAEYLSERGFAVLRYNKRGVGLNGTILDLGILENATFQDLSRDAGKALEVLMQQPEVDLGQITLIGHSEGTLIVPRIAVENPKVSSIVLLSAGAQNLNEIVYFQIVDRSIYYAEDTLDSNHDGLLSVDEVAATFDVENVILSPLPPQGLIENSTGQWLWLNMLTKAIYGLPLDADGDGYVSIHEELKPILLKQFDLFTTSDPESPFFSPWLQSHLALDTNLGLIGNVSASILILQGEGDTQVPVEQAYLLEQRLTEVNHPDHTLITYPGLGHSFYPVNGWIQPLGPIQEYVLSDLAAWLTDPARRVSHLTSELESAERAISDLQSNFSALERQNSELQTALSVSTTLAYFSLGIAIIAVAAAITAALRRRPEPKPTT